MLPLLFTFRNREIILLDSVPSVRLEIGRTDRQMRLYHNPLNSSTSYKERLVYEYAREVKASCRVLLL